MEHRQATIFSCWIKDGGSNNWAPRRKCSGAQGHAGGAGGVALLRLRPLHPCRHSSGQISSTLPGRKGGRSSKCRFFRPFHPEDRGSPEEGELEGRLKSGGEGGERGGEGERGRGGGEGTMFRRSLKSWNRPLNTDLNLALFLPLHSPSLRWFTTYRASSLHPSLHVSIIYPSICYCIIHLFICSFSLNHGTNIDSTVIKTACV